MQLYVSNVKVTKHKILNQQANHVILCIQERSVTIPFVWFTTTKGTTIYWNPDFITNNFNKEKNNLAQTLPTLRNIWWNTLMHVIIFCFITRNKYFYSCEFTYQEGLTRFWIVCCHLYNAHDLARTPRVLSYCFFWQKFVTTWGNVSFLSFNCI